MIPSFTLKTPDGLDLQYYEQPVENPRAVICLVHGMGEHIGRYAHVGEYFQKSNMAVIGFDQRGHGKSQGKRGHTPSYELLMDSVAQLIKTAASKYPNVPLILYGHSMGGNLALNYAIRNGLGIKAVVGSSPYLRLSFIPPKWKVALANIMGSIAPGLQQPTGLDVAMLSRDKGVAKAYENDPLVHDKITVSYYLNIENSGAWAIEHAVELNVPALVFHGTGDKITSHEATQEFAQNSKGKADIKLFEDFYHETHNEPEKYQVLEFVEGWITAKI